MDEGDNTQKVKRFEGSADPNEYNEAEDYLKAPQKR
jgi:hypothetical protein